VRRPLIRTIPLRSTVRINEIAGFRHFYRRDIALALFEQESQMLRKNLTKLNMLKPGLCMLVMLFAVGAKSQSYERIPEGPQVRIIPLAAPLKAKDQYGMWMHPEYTAEDIIEMIEGLKPQVLERYITGAQDPDALVPVREGQPRMTVKEFLDASMDGGAPGCIIIPKLNLTWFSWGKGDYFWKAAENNYNLPLKRPIRITNLDNWNDFIEVHGEEKLREVVKRLKSIGYELIGVNSAGGYKSDFAEIDFIDFLINDETWEIRTSTLDKFKADPNVKQYYLYIDYPGQMEKFMNLPVDKQADIFTGVIAPAEKREGFTFVYPVLFDFWDANKQLTSKNGGYQGASMYEVIRNQINPDEDLERRIGSGIRSLNP
jgi:hypothetical protein